jgi:hypothetical protein
MELWHVIEHMVVQRPRIGRPRVRIHPIACPRDDLRDQLVLSHTKTGEVVCYAPFNGALVRSHARICTFRPHVRGATQ